MTLGLVEHAAGACSSSRLGEGVISAEDRLLDLEATACMVGLS